MKIRLSAGLAAGVVVTALSRRRRRVAGPTVDLRIEGPTRTLLERTQVTAADTPPPVDRRLHRRHARRAALDVATARRLGPPRRSRSTILGESHTFADNDFWAEWLDTGGG